MASQIDALPDVPSRAAPSTFSSRMDAFLAALPMFRTQTNTVATEAETNASTASAAAITAISKAADAVAAADAAAASSNATKWISGTTYAEGDVVWSPVDYQTYRRIVAGAGTTDPSADTTNWTRAVFVPSSIYRSTRTSNTILGAADKGKLIDVTSGTFTQTFDAAATLGDGWYCYLQNSGTGDITLDPDGTELIDGLASYIMYPGEVRLIQCDGTALRSVVLQSFYKTFTATDTFIKPPGYSVFAGFAWSAGASGSKNGTSALGGGGGGCFPFTIPASLFAASETITIGAGGAASTTATQNNGGNTTIGSLLTVVGAGSGAGGAIARTNSTTAITTTSSVATGFEASTITTAPTSTIYGGGSAHTGAGPGSSSIFGGGAGGGFNTTAHAGGTSLHAGNGGDCGDSTDGVDGTAPAGGGGGTNAGTQSGAGARGEVRIWGIL